MSWDFLPYAASLVVAVGVLSKPSRRALRAIWGFVWGGLKATNRSLKQADDFALLVPKMMAIDWDTLADLISLTPGLERLIAVEPVVVEIASEFRTDSGSHLKDDVRQIQREARSQARTMKRVETAVSDKGDNNTGRRKPSSPSVGSSRRKEA